jgi:hypothetical protein
MTDIREPRVLLIAGALGCWMAVILFGLFSISNVNSMHNAAHFWIRTSLQIAQFLGGVLLTHLAVKAGSPAL